MAETLSHTNFEGTDLIPRICEVFLTNEQRERLQQDDFDGVLQFGETREEDVLSAEVENMIVGFFWADEQRAKVVVPGKELTRCLSSINESGELDVNTLAKYKIYAEVYEHRAYRVQKDRVEVLEPILPS